MNESTLDMMQLDRTIETLAFQICAYKKAKELDHQPLMEYNLHAINSLCRNICSVLESEERRNAKGGVTGNE